MTTSLTRAKGWASIRTLCPHRVLPVVVIQDAGQAEKLRTALKSGGLPCVEITLRTPAAVDTIAAISQDPEFTVGAGTVLTAGQVDQAKSAGARFVVSPGFSRAVADECQKAGLPYFPGVATPTEIQQAMDVGLHELKFFPAETFGGAGALKAIAAPFRDLVFIPTGGIGASSMRSYLALPQVAAVGGTWIASEALLQSGNFGRIARLASEAARLATDPSETDA